MNKLLSIGEVAKIMGIKIATLRFYDAIGLIKPKGRDPNTGYRYYDHYQLPHIALTLEYKLMGCNLNDIKKRFEYGNNPRHVADHLVEQINKASKQVKEMERGIRLHREKVKNIRRDLVSARNKGVYWKAIDKRYILACDYEHGHHPDDSMLFFYKLYKELRDMDLMTVHESGFIVTIVESSSAPLEYTKIYYDILYENDRDQIDWNTLPRGEFLCVNYRSSTRISQIEKLKQEMSTEDIKPTLSIEVETNNDVSEFNDSLYELQCYFDVLSSPIISVA